MKKLLTVLSAFVLTLSLFACGGENTTQGKKKTVIKYCGWDLGTEEDNNIVRRLIAKFNKESDDIRIQMISTEGNPTEWLTTLAGSNNLPDVFLVENVAQAIRDKWALDLTSFVSADPEWNEVEEGLRESVTYGPSVYALPAAQDYIGYKVNYNLLNNYASGMGGEAEDIFYAGSESFTTEKLFEVAKSLRNVNPSENGQGYIGLDATGDMINWLPASLDETGQLKHFVWDGYEFQFRSAAMYDAINVIQGIAKPAEQYVLSAIPETTGSEENGDYREVRKEIFGGVSATEIFNLGRLGFIQDGTWTADTEHDFSYKFIGFPNQKVISTADYMCINRFTKNQEAAFKVAKYLTYGLQGAKDKFQIIDDNPNADLKLDGLPVVTTEEVTSKWFDYVSLNGLEEVFQAVADGKVDVLVEGNKTVPGFITARFNYATGIVIAGNRGDSALSIGDLIWDACSGTITMDDYRSNMTEKLQQTINQEIEKEYVALGITRTKPE